MRADQFLSTDGLDDALATGQRDVYAYLRQHAPLYRSRDDVVFLTRYEDVAAALREVGCHRQFGASRHPDKRSPSFLDRHLSDRGKKVLAHLLMNLDGPEHILIRRLVASYLNRDRLASLVPWIRQETEATLPESGVVDLLDTTLHALPRRVISRALGITDEEARAIAAWVSAVSRTSYPDLREDMMDDINDAFDQLSDFFAAALVDPRRPDGLLSELGKKLDPAADEDLISVSAVVINLYLAGHISVIDFLGISILELAQVQHSEGIDQQAVQELLRFNSTTQRAGRVTSAELELPSGTVSAGSEMVICLGSANHDPSRFFEPSRLDLSRENARDQLSYGGGRHFCIGAQLANLEVQTILDVVVPRVTRAVEATVQEGPTFRTIKTLTVELGGSLHE